ncbi:MAG: chromosomal replication initiator protein DnaA [Deltaproteobacteria bacterium]|jgi:chromosomal replication initiator protein|nr:chromosomal replication initiator protein DnaA [Deltaproteobacteria bacterium]MBW2477715.1 chromosomal replication initiator protein DnaA [Deltaproteobacteria bacterium]MBW2503143.1 chromosomal replication initiator protein DnaA [Deltaproteobacteria bacterium]MBW2519021.1 chromosomal replication initiator protein DnaA [Deltaproteobacteria bacterium]
MDVISSKLWQDTLAELELNLSPQHFSTWIKPLKLVKIEKDLIVLEVPNRFVLDWVKENYGKLIQKILADLSAISYNLQFDVTGQARLQLADINAESAGPNTIQQSKRQSLPSQHTHTDLNLNRKYVFKEFVSGSSNQFAYAAAMAVANNPATTYNPLFIYGGVGLGKTHLINAIGNAVLKKNPGMRVCYYTSEKFMNELINSLRYNRMDEFRKKFRSMDILLIDDIQFIAGKERTQEEFFHTFNSLYESHKQIVVTSDKFPKEIPGLEERLRSRFEWGLIADIQPPDVETKQAILKMKAEQNRIHLPEDVALFLASSVCSNVRELEGYLVRIGAFASLTATSISLDMAKNVLKDILVEKNRELTVEEIIKHVSNHFNVKISDLKSAKRLKAVVLPRQIAMFLARQLTSSSYPEIGERFGGKDHSTIIHAIRKIDKLMESDYQLRNSIESLKNSLTN